MSSRRNWTTERWVEKSGGGGLGEGLEGAEGGDLFGVWMVWATSEQGGMLEGRGAVERVLQSDQHAVVRDYCMLFDLDMQSILYLEQFWQDEVEARHVLASTSSKMVFSRAVRQHRKRFGFGGPMQRVEYMIQELACLFQAHRNNTMHLIDPFDLVLSDQKWSKHCMVIISFLLLRFDSLLPMPVIMPILFHIAPQPSKIFTSLYCNCPDYRPMIYSFILENTLILGEKDLTSTIVHLAALHHEICKQFISYFSSSCINSKLCIQLSGNDLGLLSTVYSVCEKCPTSPAHCEYLVQMIRCIEMSRLETIITQNISRLDNSLMGQALSIFIMLENINCRASTELIDLLLEHCLTSLGNRLTEKTARAILMLVLNSHNVVNSSKSLIAQNIQKCQQLFPDLDVLCILFVDSSIISKFQLSFPYPLWRLFNYQKSYSLERSMTGTMHSMEYVRKMVTERYNLAQMSSSVLDKCLYSDNADLRYETALILLSFDDLVRIQFRSQVHFFVLGELNDPSIVHPLFPMLCKSIQIHFHGDKEIIDLICKALMSFKILNGTDKRFPGIESWEILILSKAVFICMHLGMNIGLFDKIPLRDLLYHLGQSDSAWFKTPVLNSLVRIFPFVTHVPCLNPPKISRPQVLHSLQEYQRNPKAFVTDALVNNWMYYYFHSGWSFTQQTIYESCGICFQTFDQLTPQTLLDVFLRFKQVKILESHLVPIFLAMFADAWDICFARYAMMSSPSNPLDQFIIDSQAWLSLQLLQVSKEPNVLARPILELVNGKLGENGKLCQTLASLMISSPQADDFSNQVPGIFAYLDEPFLTDQSVGMDLIKSRLELFYTKCLKVYGTDCTVERTLENILTIYSNDEETLVDIFPILLKFSVLFPPIIPFLYSVLAKMQSPNIQVNLFRYLATLDKLSNRHEFPT